MERGIAVAIYHCSIKIIGRGKGKTAVGAAAYRAGERIKNEYDGQIHDYTKKGGIVHTEILLPDHAPGDYANRAVLWNAVEKIETAKNSQLAREIELALPVELTQRQNIMLAREYAKKYFVSAGMCADVCIHDTGNGNPHAHIMLTMRPINQDGTWGAKSRKEYILNDNGERIKLKSGQYKSRKVNTVDWNEQAKAEEWRGGWADIVNKYLSQHGIAGRVDNRSYERQGIDKIPTIHMGVAASQMEKKGIKTERGDINRQVMVSNNQIRQLRARIRKAKDWLYAQPLDNAPTMMSVMSGIANSRNLKTKWEKVRSLQTQANLLTFLQANEITDMAQLVDKVTKINEEFYEVSNKIKETERRLGQLEQHLAQYGNYKQHRAVYEKYKQLNPGKTNAFYNKHGEKIQLYETAKQYLRSVLNGRSSIPVNKWQAEQKKLIQSRFALCEDYYKLQDDVRSVELLLKGADSIIREEARERQTIQIPSGRGI